ncbi:MAG TPA: CoA-transferase [Vicinamibacteria bacterium]|nr:CoA-transferase [Vicinamibacteria bacterium]
MGSIAEATRSELMAVAASREISDGDVVFVGIGLPNLAVNLALRTHAPNAQLVYESGVYGSRPNRLPISIGDPCLVTGSLQVLPMTETFCYFLQGGRIDVGFLGAAQIDRFGNLNTTVIGDYHAPKVRLPGSGGAAEISWLAKNTIVLLPQKRSKFPEKLDFRTSVGHYEGGGSREALGARRGGPTRVITNLGVYGFEPTTREMILEQLHPGVTLDEARSEVSWPLRVKEPVVTTSPPDESILRLLRETLDPKGIYLGTTS